MQSKECRELTLKPHQLEHFARIMDISEKHDYYMDFSRMGTGKTFITSKVGEVRELQLAVICPVSAMDAWKKMEQYGIKIIFIVSYQSLRGTDKYPPKHGYLTRETEIKMDKRGNETKKVIFTPTDEFIDLVRQGILLVFDEGQSIKNTSDQGKAARALSSAITHPSKCAFISGSPYDKEEHSENILRFLNVLKQKRLVWNNPLTGEQVPKGILDVVMYCKELDNPRTMDIIQEHIGYNGQLSMSASKARSLCHKLFTDIIKDHLYSEMMPEDCKYPIHMEESYLFLDEDKVTELANAIQDLAQATRFNGRDVDTDKIEWGAVTLALKGIELVMLDSLTKFAMNILNEKRTDGKVNKVIISVSFLDSIKELMSSLGVFNPLFIDGSVKADDRTKRVALFNTDPKHRVLISTIKTGGISISLHDTVGDSPRHMLLIPTYSLIDIYQASGRIHRTGLMSDAYFYMIYGTNPKTKYRKEAEIKVTPILSALSRKKDVLKGLITKQSMVYKLPGEFPHKLYEM